MRHIYVLGALVLTSFVAVACGDSNTGTLGGGGAWGPNAAAPASSGASGDGTSGGTSGSSSGGTSGGGTSGSLDAAPPPPPGADAGPPPPPPPPPPSSACVPTNIQTILNQQCVGCHSNPPVNGSLSPLTNLAEMTAVSKENAAKNQAQLSALKLKASATSIMPPGSTVAANAAAAAAFDAWIASNYTLGCTAGGDAGTSPPPPPPPSDVFNGQPPFTPGSSRQGEHSANDSRIKRNCLDCHNGGDAPAWSSGGRLVDGAGNGVAGAQVRVAKADGTAGTTVYTDAIGLFWFRPGQFTPGLHAGARNATTKVNMVSAVSNGGCNSCHATGGTTTPIHLP